MHWSHNDCASFSYSLKLCVKLETLRLNNCGITFTHLRALLGELSVDDLPVLTELQLKENPLGDEGMRTLTKAISSNMFPKLASLLLKDNGASDGALGQLGDVCAMRNIDIGHVTTMWASAREHGRKISENFGARSCAAARRGRTLLRSRSLRCRKRGRRGWRARRAASSAGRARRAAAS